ncbi:MAG TPA: alpha/beta fold hydrolase [Thermoanaerobaculia bacterium]|nr:alpha/beta fold hydrolase [Thermoanaerobaculia bacterium]
MLVNFSGSPIEVRQEGSGRTVVLIHGYPLDGAMWSSVARRLSDRFRVLKPDLPGHGENPAAPEGTIDSYADFVSSVVEASGGAVGLAGFSMGGYVALALLKRRPEQVAALALVDSRAVADDEVARAKRDESIALLRQSGVEPVAEAMLGKLLAPEALTRGDLADRVRRIVRRQSAAAFESDLMAMRGRPDSVEFLSKIAIPALIVAGEKDVISQPDEGRAMAEAIPGARLTLIPGSGHLTPMESPAAVARALGDFFGSALIGT